MLNNLEKRLYKDNDVKVTHDIYELEGYSGAFCPCGATLHIKTPFYKDFYYIECPECKYVVQLYCGSYNGHINEELSIE